MVAPVSSILNKVHSVKYPEEELLSKYVEVGSSIQDTDPVNFYYSFVSFCKVEIDTLSRIG